MCLTDIIFRKWRTGNKSVIAIFPGIQGNRGFCEMYEHTGQHGEGDPGGVIRQTHPARPEEYEALRRELESGPYNCKLRIKLRR